MLTKKRHVMVGNENQNSLSSIKILPDATASAQTDTEGRRKRKRRKPFAPILANHGRQFLPACYVRMRHATHTQEMPIR